MESEARGLFRIRRTEMPTKNKFDDAINVDNPLGSTKELVERDVPSGVDRRTFIMRSAVIGAATVMTGRAVSARERTLKAFAESLEPPQGPAAPPLDKNLNVVKKGQGPVLTVID